VYADSWTQAVLPVAPIVRNAMELREAVVNMTIADATVASFTAIVFPGFRHAGASLQLATILSAGSVVGRRGPPLLVIDASHSQKDGDLGPCFRRRSDQSPLRKSRSAIPRRPT